MGRNTSEIDYFSSLLNENTPEAKEEALNLFISLQEKLKKRYGLVFEEPIFDGGGYSQEKVASRLKKKVPVPAYQKELSTHTDTGLQNNLLLEGDNLEWLSVLQNTHKGKVDVIYIDIILQSLIQRREKFKNAPLRCNFRLRCKMCAGLIAVDLFIILWYGLTKGGNVSAR